MNTYKLTLAPRTLETAPPDAQALLLGAQAKMGMIPNMYARMANAPGLLDTYLHGYDLFRKHSGFTPAEQEVVLLTSSYENGCAYCMAAHSWVAANMSKVPADVTEAIRTGAPISDPRLAALSTFTRVMFDKSGRPSGEDVAAFLAAGFTENHVLGIILAIGVKTFSNYANHVFHTPLDAAFSAFKWTPAPSIAGAE